MSELILTVDNGNTNPHVGWFVDGELKQVTKLSEVTEASVDAVGARKVDSITSKVGQDHDLSWLNPHDLSTWRNMKGFLGMPFKYAGTLGADRLVQIYYRHQNIPSRTVIIDAGTFTTIDLLDESGHLGGIILPGIETYLDVFKLKGAKLPRLARDQIHFESPATLMALNTYDAIAEGYKLLLEKAAKEVQNFEAQGVILTGGHAEQVKPLFPGSSVVPHHIHDSLYFALKSAKQLGFI